MNHDVKRKDGIDFFLFDSYNCYYKNLIVKTMTKTVVFDGKAKRVGLVRAGASKSKMNITSESQG